MIWRTWVAISATMVVLGAWIFLRRFKGSPPKELEGMDHAQRELDGVSCNVYFFRSWATYEHPVLPVEPLAYEDAIERNYYRAWMCFEGQKKTFTFFQGWSVARSPFSRPVPTVPTADRHHFFSLAKEEGEWRIVAPISADRSVDEPAFLHVKRIDDGKTSANIVESKSSGLSYRYFYAKDGALSKAVITSFDGDVNILTR